MWEVVTNSNARGKAVGVPREGVEVNNKEGTTGNTIGLPISCYG